MPVFGPVVVRWWGCLSVAGINPALALAFQYWMAGDELAFLKNADFQRVSDILCMSNLVHASELKEHEDNDDYQ